MNIAFKVKKSQIKTHEVETNGYNEKFTLSKKSGWFNAINEESGRTYLGVIEKFLEVYPEAKVYTIGEDGAEETYTKKEGWKEEEFRLSTFNRVKCW